MEICLKADKKKGRYKTARIAPFPYDNVYIMDCW